MMSSDSEFSDFQEFDGDYCDAIAKAVEFSLTWMDEDDEDFTPVHQIKLLADYESKSSEQVSVTSTSSNLSECKTKTTSCPSESKSIGFNRSVEGEIAQNKSDNHGTDKSSDKRDGSETFQNISDSDGTDQNKEGGETSNKNSESQDTKQSPSNKQKIKDSSPQDSEIIRDNSNMKRKSEERSEASPNKQPLQSLETPSIKSNNPYLGVELSTIVMQLVAALQKSDDDEDYERYDIETPTARVNLFSVSTGATPQRTRKWDTSVFHEKSIPSSPIVTVPCHVPSSFTPISSSGDAPHNSGDLMFARSTVHCSSINFLGSQSCNSSNEREKRVSPRIYTCDLCHKQCATKVSILRHIVLKHISDVNKARLSTKLSQVLNKSHSIATNPKNGECTDKRSSVTTPVAHTESTDSAKAASKFTITPVVKLEYSSNSQKNVTPAETVTCSRKKGSRFQVKKSVFSDSIKKEENTGAQTKKEEKQAKSAACSKVATRSKSKSSKEAQKAHESSEKENIKVDNTDEVVKVVKNVSASDNVSLNSKAAKSHQSAEESNENTPQTAKNGNSSSSKATQPDQSAEESNENTPQTTKNGNSSNSKAAQPDQSAEKSNENTPQTTKNGNSSSSKAAQLDQSAAESKENTPQIKNGNSSSSKATKPNQSAAESNENKPKTTQHGNPDFECEVCGRQMSSQKGLKIHATKMHKKSRRALDL